MDDSDIQMYGFLMAVWNVQTIAFMACRLLGAIQSPRAQSHWTTSSMLLCYSR